MNNHQINFENYQLIAPLHPKNVLSHTQVWQALELASHKKRVIKRLLPDFTPLQYQHFLNEYQVYQTLRQSDTQQLVYFFSLIGAGHHTSITPNEHWLIFDLSVGHTLKTLLLHNSLCFHQKIQYLIQLCHAIDILHQQGFIHCDIKPNNVFITQPTIQLFDFGLVKKIDSFCPSDTTAGTPSYMSPEQFLNHPLTYQTDYYSLGILIYETLLGQKPFLANNLQGWAMMHCQSPLPAISSFSPYMNEQLQDLFNQLLAKFPHNRPKNLDSIVTILKNLQKI